MAGPLRPGDVSGKTFRPGWRGYDQSAVDEFLEEVSSTVASLEAENDQLRERLHKLGDRDMRAEFDRVSEELAKLLSDARETAEGMRSRAAIDAELITGEALEDAIRLRQDAWDDGVTTLESAQSEADGIVEEAKRAALVTISDSEREAHRITAKARKDAEDVVRRARSQADRILVEARTAHDGIAREAEGEVTAARERVDSLAKRRDELLGQVDGLQAKINELKGELEEHRATVGKTRASDMTTVRVLPIRQPEEEPQSDGSSAKKSKEWRDPDETVRIVPPPKRPKAVPGEVDADAMAAEVRQLRVPKRKQESEPEPEEKPKYVRTIQPPPSGPPEEEPPEEEPVETTIEEAPAEEEDTAEAPLEAEATEAPTVESGPQPMRSIKDLFASLRAGNAPAPVEESEPEVAPAPEPETARESEPEPAPAADEESGGADPFELRDRLLLPVTNKTLRAVKRNLTEAQNVALDELRVQEDAWEPDVTGLEASLTADLDEVVVRSTSAGRDAASRMLNRSFSDVDIEVEESAAHEFAQAIGVGVRKALDGAGEGPRRRAAAISRVYRAWRVDEAERKVRSLAFGAYHDGLLSAFSEAGVEAVRWVPSGRPCVTCRAMVEASPVAPGMAFDGETRRPPAHASCGCTLVPSQGRPPVEW